MFSLIITIVSIALVVALVAATMYHGGDTLTQGRTTANAAAFVSGAEQIGGAAVMFKSLEGYQSPDVPTLVTKNYLSSTPVVVTPEGHIWAIDNTQRLVRHYVESTDTCLAINKAAGVPAATLATRTVGPTDIDNLPYGCLTADGTFQFKF